MALIAAVSLFMLGVINTTLSRILADEFKAWNPLIVRRLICRAVARLPRNERIRFEEEWCSHVNEVPGEIGKLFAAFGFVLAARKITTIRPKGFEPYSAIDLFVFRLRDLMSCSAVLLVAAPIYLITFLATKLSGPGPILVKVPTVGRRGRIFGLYKLRVTKSSAVGKLICRFYLDELPTLFNVLRGDMSLIGPSPARIDHARVNPPVKKSILRVDHIEKRLEERLSVLPGLTGWAQVNMRSSEYGDTAKELEYDLYYIHNRTIKLDLLILWRTLYRVVCDPR